MVNLMRINLIEERRRFEESNILFKSDERRAIDAAISIIRVQRMELKTYITLHSEFQSALQPIRIEDNAPRIVKLMSESTRPFGIGPMAAVAGVLADLAIETMLEIGAKTAIVENGGEISAFSDEIITIGLYAGKISLSGVFGFQIDPTICPIGVATSSATVSHAMSFGEADSATVFADTAGIADGAATAICNSVRGRNIEVSVREGLEVAKEFSNLIRGSIIIRGNYVGSIGRIPKLIKFDNILAMDKDVIGN